MTGKEYIENARRDGRRVSYEYANGLTFVFVRERNGWVSVLEELANGEYIPLIRALEYDHAKGYISMREPVPAGADVINGGNDEYK